MSAPPQPGCWIVALLWPQAVHRAHSRRVGSPADDGHGAGNWRRVPAPIAVKPEPGRGAVKVTEGRGGTRRLHGWDWMAGERTKSTARCCSSWQGPPNRSNSDPD